MGNAAGDSVGEEGVMVGDMVEIVGGETVGDSVLSHTASAATSSHAHLKPMSKRPSFLSHIPSLTA